MSTFLLKFEAIESRIASYSCPRGTTGRVQALRLRRCFQHSRQLETVAARKESYPYQQEGRIYQGPKVRSSFNNAAETASAQDGHIVQEQQGAVGSSKESSKSCPVRRVQGRTKKQLINWPDQHIKRDSTDEKKYGDDVALSIGGQASESPPPTQTALYSALRAGDPHVVLEALLDEMALVGISEFEAVVLDKMPATSFSELLRCIDPKHFIDRYASLFTQISLSYAKALRIPAVDSDGYHFFCEHFLNQIKKVMIVRGRKWPLALSDYKFLLKCARATGNIKAAESVWADMVRRGRNVVSPDTECYNHYIGTKCWVETLNPNMRQRLRHVPDNTGPRSWDFPPYTLRGHKVGPKGLKVQVSSLFQQMVDAGIPGNEETLCLMIVALSREGDVSGVESILKSVWNVDVEALLSVDEAELVPTKHLPYDSPFHPSSKLLFTLAHAYGINNAIPTALRVIDFISRQYSVLIPSKAWSELLQWTYVLSMKRNGARLNDGADTGQLPPEAVTNLWDTMTSEPYNVKPNLEMYDKLIANLFMRQRWAEAQLRMMEARRLHKSSVLNLSRQKLIYDSTTPRQSNLSSTVFERRGRDLAFAHLKVQRNRQYLRRWVRNLIHRGSKSLKYDEEWSPRHLPRVVQDWFLFLPNSVKYDIDTGRVEFWRMNRGANYNRQLRLSQNKGLHKRRRMRRRLGRRLEQLMEAARMREENSRKTDG